MEKEILELLKSMQNSIETMQNDMKSMKSDISELKVGQERIEKKLDGVTDQTADLTEYRTTTTANIESIKTDVKFVKRKVQDTEEDVFVIQDHLQIVK